MVNEEKVPFVAEAFGDTPEELARKQKLIKVFGPKPDKVEEGQILVEAPPEAAPKEDS